jgi:hypothetical protein
VLKEAAKKRDQYAAAILKEIDSPSYCDWLNLGDQNKVRSNIRAVVLEYIKDEAIFIPTFFNIDAKNIAVDGIPAKWRPVDAIHVPEGYRLSGAKAGGLTPRKRHAAPPHAGHRAIPPVILRSHRPSCHGGPFS